MDEKIPDGVNLRSAKIRFAFIKDNQLEQFIDDCVYIFSSDEVSSYDRAVLIGKKEENLTGWVDEDGNRVVKKFIDVITLNYAQKRKNIYEVNSVYEVHSDWEVLTGVNMYRESADFIYDKSKTIRIT